MAIPIPWLSQAPEKVAELTVDDFFFLLTHDPFHMFHRIVDQMRFLFIRHQVEQVAGLRVVVIIPGALRLYQSAW